MRATMKRLWTEPLEPGSVYVRAASRVRAREGRGVAKGSFVDRVATVDAFPKLTNPSQKGIFSGTGDRDRKHRGGYYTPEAIASILAAWAISDSSARVLEPSAGDGQVVGAAARRVVSPGCVVGIELDAGEAEKIIAKRDPNTSVIVGDFFAWFQANCAPSTFDAVVGNPPFIRYQHFREEHREAAFDVMRAEGLHPSRLTNAWLPFVVAATRALRPGGRLALVLPAELLQVTYAGELREYLARKYSHLTVVTFRALVFDGILQETVLLLGIRCDSAAQIAFVELSGVEELRMDQLLTAPAVEVNLDHAREKWTQYYLSPSELGFIRELEETSHFSELGDYAEVDVGVVTGRNEFFVLTRAEAERYGVLDWCLPLVGRSAQTPGLILRRDDWDKLVQANGRCYLLQLGDTDRIDLAASALAYVEAGEREKYHDGYKCRIRLPRWWKVPSVWVPDAFLLRQVYDGPRIIVNRAGATSTDTIHRVRTKDGIAANWLAAASMNSMTWAFSEIRGRSYGGGVLEIEPTEAEGLPIPEPCAMETSVEELDREARRRGVESMLDEVDRLTLLSAGLSHRDTAILRGIWRKLYQRRMSRRRR